MSSGIRFRHAAGSLGDSSYTADGSNSQCFVGRTWFILYGTSPSLAVALVGCPPAAAAVLLLQRTMHPLMLPFCLDASPIRSATIPSFIHHTASRDSPAMGRGSERRPLSVRIASGHSYREKHVSKIACTRACPSFHR